MPSYDGSEDGQEQPRKVLKEGGDVNANPVSQEGSGKAEEGRRMENEGIGSPGSGKGEEVRGSLGEAKSQE